MPGLPDRLRIDGRLAVLGGHDEERGLVEALVLERLDHAGEGLVGLSEPIGQDFGRRPRAVEVAAGLAAQRVAVGLVAAGIGVVVGELLPHAHCLEVHAEDGGRARRGRPVVRLAVDLVQDALDLLEIVLDRAHHAESGVESVDVRDLRRVEVRVRRGRSPGHKRDACPPRPSVLPPL